MRRLLSILLLLILPLQFCYAVAASYCVHEAGQSASHFGHHVHVHKGGDQASGATKSKTKLFADNDCVSCHLAKAELLGEPVKTPTFMRESASPSGDALLYSSVDPNRIERPNWLQLL
jgi:hypothetical protein